MSESVSEQLPEGEKEDSLARVGAKYIFDATMRFPGLAAAEGIEIARVCQISKLDPAQLKEKLLDDEDRIQWLIDQGNKQHPKNNIPRVVERPRMVEMIIGIFDYAKDAMGNTDEELTAALEQYPKCALVDGYYDEPKFDDLALKPLERLRAGRAK